jgi:hypothetical protein
MKILLFDKHIKFRVNNRNISRVNVESKTNVSETSYVSIIRVCVTRLIAREDFITLMRRKSFKPYKIGTSFPVLFLTCYTHEIIVEDAEHRSRLLSFESWRSRVQISARRLAILTKFFVTFLDPFSKLSKAGEEH